MFTNIPLKKTIGICLDRLYRGDPAIRPYIPEKTLEGLLKLCVCDNTFVFNGRIYQQTDGVAMGSSLGPLLANIYMAHLEEEFLLKNNLLFSPTFYRRYVDDTFCLFRTRDHVQKFLAFINFIDPAIQFDSEVELNDELPFLDTLIKRHANNLYPEISTKIKSTDKGLFYNFNSFIPESYKHNLVYCLIHRIYSIASSYIIFHKVLLALKQKFLKNGFSSFIFDSNVCKYLNNQYTPKPSNPTVLKKRIIFVMPYLGPLSILIKRRLKRLISKFYPLVELKIVFKRGNTIKDMFSYKDRFPLKNSSGVVYQVQCEACGSSATYIGKTANKIHERFYGSNGHLNPATKASALLEHLALNFNPKCEFNANIRILDSCSHELQLRYAESIHLKFSKQTLNTQECSIPLLVI